MEEQKFLTEGILNQFGKSICGDIPILLSSMCEKYFKVEEETSRIVAEHLIERIYLSDSTYYEKIKTPERSTLKKLDKKRRYQLDRLLGELQKESEAIARGEEVENTASPYNPFTMKIIQDAAKLTREDCIAMITSQINDFKDLVMNQESGKRSRQNSEFHGFYEYPYFTALAMHNSRKAEKLLRIDLEEFVVYCAALPKYNQYVSYPADSVGRGFYGEIVRSKKEDAEYEIITSQYLKNTFFPEEQGIEHVKIISRKPWDLKDMDLFGYLCTKGMTELLRAGLTGKTVEVEGTMRDLCKVVSPTSKSFGTKSYALVQARLENMIDTKLEAITVDGHKIMQQLFDRVILDDVTRKKNSEKEAQKQGGFYKLRLGLSLTEDILSHRLSTVIKPRISELKNQIGIVLYAPLKKERAVDLCLYNKDSHEYSIISLMLMYRLDARKRATRIEKFSEVFTEMKDKGLLIKDFSVVDSKFIIEWMPLSQEEKNDIRVLKKGPDAVIDVTPIELPLEPEEGITEKES